MWNFIGVTFSESVITLKPSRKKATRKVKGPESTCHLDFLKDLGKVIVGKRRLRMDRFVGSI